MDLFITGSCGIVFKKKIITVHGALALAMGVLMTPFSSYAGNQECLTLAKVSYAFAEVRDSGAPIEDVLGVINKSYRNGQLSENDYEMSAFFLKFVYTGGQQFSPEEVRRQIAILCNKYQPD